MTTIWSHYAPNTGNWTNDPSTGWSLTVSFDDLGDLVDRIRRSGVGAGSVTRLAIVAHGDSDGVVRIDRDLTAGSIRYFEPALRAIGRFLTRGAFLEFYSCVAAAGLSGDALLSSLSRILPGRTIVGFVINGEFTSGFDNAPGNVGEAAHAAGSGRAGVRLDPWHYAAKWARDGAIVREAIFGRDRENRCGNPSCPGHESALHHCAGWPIPDVPR